MNEKDYLGLRFSSLSKKIDRYMGNSIYQCGLSNIQGKMINFLFWESKVRDIFQKDIEEKFHIRSSSVTSALNLMEEHSLIERVSVKEDGRLKKIVLKEKGYELQGIVQKTIEEVENEMIKSLTEEERKNLLYLLDKVNRNFVV